MQIREMDFKELYIAYDVVKELHKELSYDEFEDLVYDMKHMNYKMFGVFQRGKLMTYAGVAVQTTLAKKRHLRVFDMAICSEHSSDGYDKEMLNYLQDYAKTCMCGSVVF